MLTTFWGLPIVDRAESLRPNIGARANHASGAPPDEVLLAMMQKTVLVAEPKNRA